MKPASLFITAALLAALGLTAPPHAVAQEESSDDSGQSLDQLLNLPSDESDSESGSAQSESDDPEAEQGEQDDPDQQNRPDEPEGGSASEPAQDGGGESIELPEEQSPGEFMKAIQDMKLAGDRLTTRADAGIETQRVQERALRRLDQMIEQMRNQQQSSGGNSQQQSQQQDTGSQQNQSRQQEQKEGQAGERAEASSDTAAQQAGRQGQVREGDTEDEPLTENLSEWGNLPQRLRDQLLQGADDRFSPLYRSLTERYYRRLAEESR